MTAHTPASDVYLQSFEHIDVKIDPDHGIVWVYQRPYPRPCFNPGLISEVRSIQMMLEAYDGRLPYRGDLVPIHYHVLDSSTPGIFSLGGDLDLFRDHVLRGDRDGLMQYAKSCIDVMYDYITGFHLPITTISLVRGDALGGGFEVALSGHVLIAEQQAELGFPEILFNVFPGMGAYHLLSQRLTPAQVDSMMICGRKYTADELLETGVVDRVAATDCGEHAVYDFVRENQRHRAGYLAIKKVRQKVHSISYENLMDVCSYWVDVTMQVSERDLKLMQRLVAAQARKSHGDNRLPFQGRLRRA